MPSIPLAANSVALLACLASCGVESAEDGPCGGEACDGHGTCYVGEDGSAGCVCAGGYVNDGPLRCAPEHGGRPGEGEGEGPAEGEGEGPAEGEGEGSAEGEGEGPAEGEGEGAPACERACLDGRTLRSCVPTDREYLVECPAGATCTDDRCVVEPDEAGPCGRASPVCWVTDELDVLEQSDHAVDLSAYGHGSASRGELCGEDGGYPVGMVSASYTGSGLHWLANTLALAPPPGASHYLLDAKLGGWGEETSGVVVLFGDDQRLDYAVGSETPECIFTRLGVFSTAGISGTAVRVNLEEAESRLGSYVFFAKIRLWSCGCE